MWKYSGDNKKNVVVFVILSILSNFVNLALPLVVAHILNKVQTSGVNADNFKGLLLWFTAFIVIEAFSWLFHGPSRIMERKNAFVVRANFKKFLFDGVLDLPQNWHTERHSGDTIDKISRGTSALHDFSENVFIVISAVITFVGSFIALAFFNLHSIYIALFMTIIALTIVSKFDAVLVPQYKKLNRAQNKVSEKIFDTISNISTIIILRVEPFISRMVYQRIMSPYKLYNENVKINEYKWFLVSIVGGFMTFFVLSSYVISSVNAGAVILVGTLYALYSYAERVTRVMFDFTYLYSKIVRQRASVANAEELSEEFVEKVQKPSVNLLEGWKTLEIKNLSFSYDSGEGVNLHLENLNLKIMNGQNIALIGESGSGKSTFLRVFRELYSPSSLELFIDNHHLKGGFSAISSGVSLIPQDPEIFSTTIKENITLGITRSQEEIEHYVDMALFGDVVRKLPKKYQSSIVERGVNLSGGEKQRLALARGLLASSDKTFVLLDEPTSSVDSKNERAIYENIFREFNEKTIISSIHRLHLLTLFDNIFFFDNGEIIDSGTFDELYENSPRFRKLWEKYTKSQNKEQIE